MAETLDTSTVFTSDSKTVLNLAISCIELMILNTKVGRKNKKSGFKSTSLQTCIQEVQEYYIYNFILI